MELFRPTLVGIFSYTFKAVGRIGLFGVSMPKRESNSAATVNPEQVSLADELKLLVRDIGRGGELATADIDGLIRMLSHEKEQAERREAEERRRLKEEAERRMREKAEKKRLEHVRKVTSMDPPHMGECLRGRPASLRRPRRRPGRRPRALAPEPRARGHRAYIPDHGYTPPDLHRVPHGRIRRDAPRNRSPGGIPVLWLINNDDATPPWGKVARIEQQTEDAAV